MPADLQPERRLEDYSFGARLAAKEIVLLGDARRELDQSFPGDRAALERGVRSVIVAPLVFGDTLGGVLAFAKHDPDWFDEGDAEVVSGIAAQVVVALQHQRLSEEQQRVAVAEQHSRWLERRVERLRGALAERYGFDSIMGRSGAIREALDQAALVAGQETTVLLTGESGTGKELVARAIHYASRRSDGPFVAVNCAALPETLAESQRFGHDRGPVPPSRSRAKGGPGRSWSAAPSTTPADVPTGRSWRSTAPHCPKRWRSPSSSDMSEERSPAPIVSSAVASRSPPAARSSSMRSAISPRRSRRSCSACCKNGSTNGSAARRRWGPMSGWSQPRTVICSIWSRPGRSARTCITGSRCSGFIFPRCGNVKETSSSSPNTSYAH